MPLCQEDVWQIPAQLTQLKPFIDACRKYQATYLSVHNYWYLTCRFEEANQRSSLWHVDGFSQRYEHVPETNYVWCPEDATCVYDQPIQFPPDFDGTKHRLYRFVEQHVKGNMFHVKQLSAKKVFLLDPYVIHSNRR
jgi:hypothetical protein